MKMPSLWSLGIAIVLLAALPAAASAQNAADDARVKANEKVVKDFWREVIQARNTAALAKFHAPDVIQHNPNVASGIDGAAAYLNKFWQQPMPGMDKADPAPVLIMGQGDLVLVMLKIPRPDPDNPKRMYDAYWL